MAKQQLTEEQKQNILNYGDQIKFLPSFVEKVRQTADVYIGEDGSTGFITLVKEVIQNGTDEIQKDESPCDKIIITFDERSLWVIVEDNGRGFPHGQIENIISEDHTSSNYEKKKGQYTAGKNGMGIGIVNALSSEFYVESSILGTTHRVEFYEGIPWDKGELEVKSNKYQGSIVSFRPCIDVLGDISVSWQEVFNLVSLIVPELKIGATVVFNAIDMKGIHHNEVLVNEDGIMTHMINMCSNPMIQPIYIQDDTGEMKAEVLITYDIEDTNASIIRSFNNFCPTSSGTHEAGFIDGLCNYFRWYINKVYLNGKKLQVTNVDILTGLRAVVNTCLLKPKYDGQNKDILNNNEIKPFIAKMVYNGLEEWTKTKPKDLQKVCKWIKDIAEIRLKNDSEKIKITNNYKKGVLSKGLPAKYAKPTGKNKGNWELIIVEGDSAAGSAKTGRDPSCQGIMGIRGKFPNAMKKSRQSMLANAEAASLISILDNGNGTNVGSRFDINKCPYQKVIIMTDADEDGVGHIRPLLLKFFLVYMTPIVTAGRLYAAQPPLFGAKIGKKNIYFSNDIEMSKFIIKEFNSKNNITDIRDKRLTSEQLTALFLRNTKYLEEMTHISASFAVEPHLLEVILNNYKFGYEKLKQAVESKWRFLSVSKQKNTIIIDGAIGDRINTVPVDERLLGCCGNLLQMISRSEEHYKINGQLKSLYDTIYTLDSYKPNNIKRYKGLGEMDADILSKTTLHPSHDRHLIRYTVEDIKKEINEIRKIESDFSVLLKDIRGINKNDLS